MQFINNAPLYKIVRITGPHHNLLGLQLTLKPTMGEPEIEDTQIAAFQAGTAKRDAIYGLLFPLAQFHLDVSITPVTKAEQEVIDPDLWIKAFVRGTRATLDLAVDWQPWGDFDRPVTELRVAYGIEPRG